ncbi:MAG TPA: hypothetical protein ENJ20_04110 [Bacteroidetes bacterium]|nr:hypothetical protein [Bacteroidota bacterium]
MDQLEKYIRDNRKAFDTEVPDLRVWAKIDRQLDRQAKPRVVWMQRLSVAAAVVVLVAAATVAGFKMGASALQSRSLADISPEYAEMEKYYREQIREKMAILASYQQDGFVKSDLKELDALYEELKKELRKAPPGNEKLVIQAMIRNFQTKVDILEQVLQRVQKAGQTNFKIKDNEKSI